MPDWATHSPLQPGSPWAFPPFPAISAASGSQPGAQYWRELCTTVLGTTSYLMPPLYKVPSVLTNL